MEKVEYLGFKNCLRLSNSHVELVITTEFGPRILHYGATGGPNILGHFLDKHQATEMGHWKPYGGHRLWVAPEAMPHSYAPDNDPVEYRIEGTYSVRLTQPVDSAGIEKEMIVSLDPNSDRVEIHHRLTNRQPKMVEAAPWALTIFSEGEAFLPLEPFRSHDDALLPRQSLILWPFTDLSDHRIRFGGPLIRFTSDPTHHEPTKIGLMNRGGWAAYRKGETVFVKSFAFIEGARYPDLGSNTELYTDGPFLEVETLGPLVQLQPGHSTDHVERWRLFQEIRTDALEPLLESLSHPAR